MSGPREPTYVQKLIDALSNREPLTRVRAAWLLGKLRAAKALDPLASAIDAQSDDPEFIAAAAEALGRIGDPTAVPVLIQLARTSLLKARVTAVESLVEWRDRDDVRQCLEAALHDRNALVREAAARALHKSLPS